MVINFIAQREFQEIARRHHITMKEVKTRIQTAILQAMQSENKAVQIQWEQVPRKGDVPTPEEFFDYLVSLSGGWNEKSSLWISIYLGSLIDCE